MWQDKCGVVGVSKIGICKCFLFSEQKYRLGERSGLSFVLEAYNRQYPPNHFINTCNCVNGAFIETIPIRYDVCATMYDICIKTVQVMENSQWTLGYLTTSTQEKRS